MPRARDGGAMTVTYCAFTAYSVLCVELLTSLFKCLQAAVKMHKHRQDAAPCGSQEFSGAGRVIDE